MLLMILGIIVSVGIMVGAVIFVNNCDYDYAFELLGLFFVVFGVVGIILFTGLAISLFDIEGQNRGLYLQMEQEYMTINQYIKSDKSDSLLESQDMMNRIKEYNNTLIEKQNDMTRPIMKYWTTGANWNELKLIDLEGE